MCMNKFISLSKSPIFVIGIFATLIIMAVVSIVISKKQQMGSTEMYEIIADVNKELPEKSVNGFIFNSMGFDGSTIVYNYIVDDSVKVTMKYEDYESIKDFAVNPDINDAWIMNFIEIIIKNNYNLSMDFYDTHSNLIRKVGIKPNEINYRKN